ncbi:MAG: phosphoglucosamine mutase, partial [Alphaproteobacteria bacterium]|nr:phosphoglucosamine mutase [Alphaproteobacteria bacterium]
MTEKLFGTDGIRGQANTHPMTANQLLTVAQAAATLFLRGDHRHRVVIGKDTRLSGYMFEPALTAGFISAGMDVVLTGPLPTPAIAMLTKSLRADLGVMISASHNPYEDNGVKFFGPDGYKLTDEQENFISSLVANPSQIKLADTSHLGRATRMADAEGRYIEWMKATFPDDLRLDGVKIVLDCANGAAYKVAPAVLWELGAEVITLANSPNGKNINALCGATHPQLM